MNAPNRTGQTGLYTAVNDRRPTQLSATDIARVLLDQMEQRGRYLPGATFEDPQWLMMLELFIATEEQRPVSVSSLCFASGVPSTTALRHIKSLEAKGLFERTSHPRDKRISHMRLTDLARNQISRYLRSIGSSGAAGSYPPLRTAH